jgi:hypothetical protein
VRDVDERIEQPAPQPPPARRGHRLIDHVEQRALRALADDGLDQLEVRDGSLVEHHRIAGVVADEPRDRQGADRLRRLRVGDHRRGGAQRVRTVVERRVPEQGPELAPRRIRRRHRRRVPRRAIALANRRDRALLFREHRRIGEHLARRDADQLVEHRRGGKLGRVELAGGRVEVREPDRRVLGVPAGGDERGQVARQLRVEHLVVEHDAGRDHANDLALDQALGELGVLHLLADRDLVAELGQLGEVAARGVIGHAAHRDRVLFALVARREHEIERARRDHRVLEEHLVEVAAPKEEQRVGVLLLQIEVLPHQRRLCRRPGHRGAVSRPSDIARGGRPVGPGPRALVPASPGAARTVRSAGRPGHGSAALYGLRPVHRVGHTG